MKILFLVDSLGRTRHFRNVIADLTAREHTVILATPHQQKPPEGFYDHPRIQIVTSPSRRADKWEQVADPLRRARDRLRFLDPRYSRAVKLAQRAASHAPKGWNAAIERHPWISRHWRAVDRLLALAETVTPCAVEFTRFVRDHAPDVVLVTPLVEFGLYQTDYVKCAHGLGVPVVFLPFSWDNLTNRGLIRVPPDRVLVWNAQQRREAVELHGMRAERVVVTGAPRFDDFFAMEPSSTREKFCGRLGLDPERPLVLYVCSANFIAPREVGFVRAWVAALRNAPGDSWVRRCSVLVRPHPANDEEWETADLSDLADVAVWTKRSTMNADRGLFDSLFHSAAVVGLNTSAMIEAAIVGRPVYTIAASDFAGGQHGTLHFSYLLVENGGVVSCGGNLDEHVRQLAGASEGVEDTRARSRRFLESFVRPHGLDHAAGPIMADEIERAGALRKRPRPAAVWHYPLRWGLDAAVRAGFDPTLQRSGRWRLQG